MGTRRLYFSVSKHLGIGQERDLQMDTSYFSEHAKPWFAVRVKTRFEKRISDTLTEKGFTSFLPQYAKHTTWSDRVVKTTAPLFPGYVFFQMEVNDNWLPVLTTPGVFDLVSCGGAPAQVDRGELASLHRVLNSSLLAEPWPFIEVGRTVVVEKGALTGIEGTLIEIKSRSRLVITVSLLQRSVAVEIDRSWVSPVRKGPGREESREESHAMPKQ